MALKKSARDHQGILQKAGKCGLYSFSLLLNVFIVKDGGSTYGKVDNVKSGYPELQDIKLSSEAAIPSPAVSSEHIDTLEKVCECGRSRLGRCARQRSFSEDAYAQAFPATQFQTKLIANRVGLYL